MISHELRYEAPPLVSVVAPALGPAAGGTNLTLSGANLGGGSHYECRFGRMRVPAVELSPIELAPADVDAPSASSATSAVHCLSPPFGAFERDDHPLAHRLELHRAPLALSLNGQQFTSLGTYFAYHHEPRLDSLVPLTGPRDGGLVLTLRGASLDGGDRSQFDHLWLSQVRLPRIVSESFRVLLAFFCSLLRHSAPFCFRLRPSGSF